MSTSQWERTSTPNAASRALADHGYAAPSPQAARRRHAYLAADAMRSTGVSPVVAMCVGPPPKLPRLDTMTLNLERVTSRSETHSTAQSLPFIIPLQTHAR